LFIIHLDYGQTLKLLEDYVMKKMVFHIIPVMLVIMGCASSGTPATAIGDGSPGMDLDVAIREAAAQMEAKIPSKTMVALVSVASPSTAFSTQVLTRLESAIVSSGKLVVVDRANLDKVREEQGFQLSGEVDDESAKSIGKLLGAGAIVTGSLADLGDVYSLTFKAINIETATVAVSYLADLTKSARVETLLASGGGAVGTQTAQRRATGGNTATAAPQAPATPEAPPLTYNIGDTGPAGGIVFFDMGFYMDGWRYLEAAPQDFPTKAKWSTHWNLAKMETGVGTGKQNTVRLVSELKRVGEATRAAQVVSVPKYGGYDDWFLPSIDELRLMYENLKMREIGGFSNDVYWSSSGGGSGTSWAQQMNFIDGRQYNADVDADGLVRAVRRF
jgi:hypothetical protein